MRAAPLSAALLPLALAACGAAPKPGAPQADTALRQPPMTGSPMAALPTTALATAWTGPTAPMARADTGEWHPEWHIEEDEDGDGTPNPLDCAPFDPRVAPGATEVCGDGVVNDCDRRAAGAADEVCALWQGEVDAWATFWWASDTDRYDRVSMADVGDINGDGHNDLGFGLKEEGYFIDPDGELTLEEHPGSFTTRGGVLVVPGPIDPISYEDRVRLTSWVETVRGDTTDHIIGSAIEGVGDLDGDGFGELIFGNDRGVADTVWLAWGPSFTSMSEAQTLYAGPAGGCMSYTHAMSPDLSGDGGPDIILGGPCNDLVLVYAGGSLLGAGSSPAPLATLSSGRGGGEGFGVDVHAEHDLTGDGVLDLVVSATKNAADPDPGYVAVFAGPVSGSLGLDAAVAMVHGEVSAPPTLINTWPGVAISAGDVDGDGYADLAMGDPVYAPGAHLDAGGGAGGVWIFAGPLPASSGLGDAISRFESDVEAFGGQLDVRRDLDGDGRADVFASCGFAMGEGYYGSIGMGGRQHAYAFFAPFGGVRSATAAELHVRNLDVTSWGAQAQVADDLTGDGWPDLLVGGTGSYFQLFEVPGPVDAGTWGSAWR
jgi:hypothetical protein